MVFQEALSLIIRKDKLSENNVQLVKSSAPIALKYVFDCFDRVDVEERQYPKVKCSCGS